MRATLGATMFVKDGFKYDYNFRETISSLSFADRVVVCVVDSDDGTTEACKKLEKFGFKIIVIDDTMWNLLSGKERLNYFSNVAIANLDTDWNLYIQADEAIHEDSIPFIREAINTAGPDVNGFMCRRYNLWNTPYQYLTCPLDRQPCSTGVIRLARSQFRTVGDAESIGIDGQLSMDYWDKIEIFHAGFVRKRDIMKAKVIQMQENIFQTPHDARLDEDAAFNPMRYFSKEDLSPIPKPLPAALTEWAKERMY